MVAFISHPATPFSFDAHPPIISLFFHISLFLVAQFSRVLPLVFSIPFEFTPTFPPTFSLFLLVIFSVTPPITFSFPWLPIISIIWLSTSIPKYFLLLAILLIIAVAAVTFSTLWMVFWFPSLASLKLISIIFRASSSFILQSLLIIRSFWSTSPSFCFTFPFIHSSSSFIQTSPSVCDCLLHNFQAFSFPISPSIIFISSVFQLSPANFLAIAAVIAAFVKLALSISPATIFPLMFSLLSAFSALPFLVFLAWA